MLSIELSPSGSFRLHFPSHFVDIPCSEKGAELLQHVLQHYAAGSRKVAQEGAPTQAQIIALLLGDSWGEEKQLAGDRKRWKDIEAATGIRVKRYDSSGKRKDVSLEDIGL